MRITVFPHLTPFPGTRPNPYIHDLVQALSALPDVEVANPPHANPLLSLLPLRRQGDVVILNWFESIPDFRHGRLQALIAAGWFLLLKARGKKIVWMLHNKHPHDGKRQLLKRMLTSLAAHGSDLIVTHATEGLSLIRSRFPGEADKAHFLHHPTKDRLETPLPAPITPQWDFLVWGHITAYKGILELLQFLSAHPQPWRVCIVGACSSPGLRKQLESFTIPNVECEFRALPFDELREYIRRTRFVLIPYHAASVLSSGILMDSLSFGARIVGPDTGSFRDYACEPRLKVYTFHGFDELNRILYAHADEAADPSAYRDFLTENDWPHYVRRLIALINR